MATCIPDCLYQRYEALVHINHMHMVALISESTWSSLIWRYEKGLTRWLQHICEWSHMNRPLELLSWFLYPKNTVTKEIVIIHLHMVYLWMCNQFKSGSNMKIFVILFSFSYFEWGKSQYEKLQGWKMNNLSIDERFTLAQFSEVCICIHHRCFPKVFHPPGFFKNDIFEFPHTSFVPMASFSRVPCQQQN